MSTLVVKRNLGHEAYNWSYTKSDPTSQVDYAEDYQEDEEEYVVVAECYHRTFEESTISLQNVHFLRRKQKDMASWRSCRPAEIIQAELKQDGSCETVRSTDYCNIRLRFVKKHFLGGKALLPISFAKL